MSPYGDTLERLFGRTADGIKLGLASTRALLDALLPRGCELPRAILVAGTNGKGSTAALVAGALGAAGHRVGFFASPHLLRFSERIRVGADTITPEEVEELYAEIERIEHRCPTRPTFFECTTVMAVLTFVRRNVDVAVFEVGLGGRLDATNALERDLAIVTPIALDHQRFLGTDLAAIAREKADIIPRQGTVVVADQPAAALAVLERTARERSARLVLAPRPRPQPGGVRLDAGGDEVVLRLRPHPPYQASNVATAFAACRELDRAGIRCPDDALQAALHSFDWPGRYQWVGGDLLLDGAHNPAAVDALCSAIGQDPHAGAKPMHCVFSALRDKAAEQMLERLSPRASLHLCPLPSRRNRSVDELRALAPDARVCDDAESALAAARRAAAADNGYVLVTGSLMLVGQALALATGAERDPPVDG